jgi:hypothetical protein
MDSHDELALNRAAAPGPDLAAIEKVWERLEKEGVMAATEELMRISHEDVEFHSYIAHGAARPGDGEVEVMRGSKEVMTFFRNADENGVAIKARAKSFEVEGENIVVRGSMRVVRPEGSFAETNLRWTYHFRDGLIDEITWQPRAGE